MRRLTVLTPGEEQSTIRVEDLTDEEFNELFGRPGVAVKQELKHLLKQRLVCDGCGNFDCTGCFAPDFAASAAGQVAEDDIEVDFFPSLTEPQIVEPEEPQTFIPFEGTINSLESKVIPASHQVNSGPLFSLPIQTSKPERHKIRRKFSLRLLHAEFCTEIKGFGANQAVSRANLFSDATRAGLLRSRES